MLVFGGRALLIGLAGVVAPLAAAQFGPRPVQVAPVTERELPATIRLVGTALPQATAIVAAEVNGVVAQINAEEGAFVRRGEPLVTLDPEVVQLQLEEARARLDSLQSRLDELENGTRTEVIQRWEATLAESRALLAKAEFERMRMRELNIDQTANTKELNDAERDYEAAQARANQIVAQLSEARTGARKEELARARADVGAARAMAALLERHRRKTVITAPFDGFVVQRRTEVGEWIEQGGAVAEMVDVERIKVRVDVPQDAIRFAQPGSPATVVVDALGRSLAAQVARVIPRASVNARTFPLEIDLPNQDHEILPGMTVWANVAAGPVGKRLMVLKDAVVPRGLEKQIFVIRKTEQGAMAVPLPVQTGLEVGIEIEVIAPGLQADDQVVCRANERLFAPTPVIPTPLQPPASQPATSAGEAAASAR